MTTIAINTFITLDGVAQAPGGPDEDRDGGFEHGGWTFPHFTDELGEIIGPWHADPGAILLGRRTYDIFAGAWPNVPEDHPTDGEMARILNSTRKFVASRTTEDFGWQNTSWLGADVPAAVAELKRQDLGEIQVLGSIALAQTLIAHDLVDEFRVAVFPVVLGTGKRLFDGGTVPAGLELVSTRTTDAGVVGCRYRRVGKPTYGTYTF